MRRSFLLAAIVALAACSPRAGAPPPSAAPPRPKVEFQPISEAELEKIHDIHAGRGKPVCQACHLPGGELVAGPVDTCKRCHKFGHNNHPVNVVQKTATAGLPLLDGGRVVCHTCHDPHAIANKRRGLRKEFNALCLSCHRRH
jgi:predicted CXXCH cytochrome family protein